jgi:hypothetical protein
VALLQDYLGRAADLYRERGVGGRGKRLIHLLSYEPKGITATVCLDGRRLTLEDVEVNDVLAMVDEAERLSDASRPDG